MTLGHSTRTYPCGNKVRRVRRHSIRGASRTSPKLQTQNPNLTLPRPSGRRKSNGANELPTDLGKCQPKPLRQPAWLAWVIHCECYQSCRRTCHATDSGSRTQSPGGDRSKPPELENGTGRFRGRAHKSVHPRAGRRETFRGRNRFRHELLGWPAMVAQRG